MKLTRQRAHTGRALTPAAGFGVGVGVSVAAWYGLVQLAQVLL